MKLSFDCHLNEDGGMPAKKKSDKKISQIIEFKKQIEKKRKNCVLKNQIKNKFKNHFFFF